MSWFSPPNCPRCGQPASLDTAWDGDFYTCHPCNRKARKEKEEREALEYRITKLENILKEQNDK